MKIRSGFVSNSSSSSFVITFKSLGDFDRFSGFYFIDTLVSDITKSLIPANKEEQREKLLHKVNQLLKDYIYSKKDHLQDYFTGNVGRHSIFDNSSEFLYNIGFMYEELEKVEEAIKEFYEVVNKKFDETESSIEKKLETEDELEDTPVYCLDEFKELSTWCYNFDVNPYAEKLCDEIIKRLEEKDIKWAVIRYSDNDPDPGGYMEHSLVPFIIRDPEVKIQGHQFSEH